MNGFMAPRQAASLLDRQIELLGNLRNAGTRAPEFREWRQATLTLIERVWPEQPTRAQRFRRIPFSVASAKAEDRVVREAFERGCAEARRLLQLWLKEISTHGVTQEAEAPRLSEALRAALDELRSPAPAAPGPRGPAPSRPRPPAARPRKRREKLSEMLGFEEGAIAPPEPAAESPRPRTGPRAPAGERPGRSIESGPVGIVPLGGAVEGPPARPVRARPAAAARSSTPPKTTAPARPAPPAKPVAEMKPVPPARPVAPGPKVPGDAKQGPPAAAGRDAAGAAANPPAPAGVPVTARPPAAPKTASAGRAEAQAKPAAPAKPSGADSMAPRPVALVPPAGQLPPAPPPAAGYEDALAHSIDSALDRALHERPVPGAAGSPAPAPEPPRARPMVSYVARAFIGMAGDLEELGVPDAHRDRVRLALLDLAHHLDCGSVTWHLMRDAVTLVMHYPALGRQALPLLLPYLETAA
jgi:hypothetical protein